MAKNWNVRGINDRKKRLALRIFFKESNCSVICLHETKRESFDLQHLRNFCPRRFNKFDFVPFVGASGGLIVIWSDVVFQGSIEFKNEFSISIQFSSVHNNDSWIITNIYEPCQSESRTLFLDWFQNIDMPDDVDWLVLGDFNYIRYPENRNREGGSIYDTNNFNLAISELDMVEISLKGRKFTWSNMQDAPLLEKLDWVFTSEAWALHYRIPWQFHLLSPSLTMSLL